MHGRNTLFMILAVCIFVGMLGAFSGGPPAGRTGAPGQQTCWNGCHNSFALNSGSANFSIFTPPVITPGSNLPVTVAFTGSDPSAFPQHGFEITARSDTGSFLGSWVITDPTNTQLIGATQEEVAHTSTGNDNTSWTVDWAAPAAMTSSSVTFYAAGVEGNDGGGNSGDFVYTTSTTVPVATMALSVTFPNTDLTISLTGTPAQASHEYQLLATLDTAPGPFLGLTPDPLFWVMLGLPSGLPGLHATFGATASANAVYPAVGTLFTGQTMRFAAFARDAAGNLSGFSNVVQVVP